MSMTCAPTCGRFSFKSNVEAYHVIIDRNHLEGDTLRSHQPLEQFLHLLTCDSIPVGVVPRDVRGVVLKGLRIYCAKAVGVGVHDFVSSRKSWESPDFQLNK